MRILNIILNLTKQYARAQALDKLKENKMLKFAHYYKSKVRGYYLLISLGSPNHSSLDKQIRVTGKREARQIANQLGATCWNF